MGYWKLRKRPSKERSYFSGGNGVAVPAGQDCRESGFAGTVGAHDRVGLAFADCQVDAAEYFLVAYISVQAFDFE